jgi:pimeloyl-ACP methyl ester carboxylesterase
MGLAEEPEQSAQPETGSQLNGEQVEVAGLSWFYREAIPTHSSSNTPRLPILFLHGLVSQGYSWREVMPPLADLGFHGIAPDLIGCGRSAMPSPRSFAYTPDAYVQALAGFVDHLKLEQFHLVAQGFLGSVGIQYALRHPERVQRLAIFNAPLSAKAKLPRKLRQMAWPLAGEMMAQDPLLVDRTLEGGGGYQVKPDALDVYRRPWLKTSDAGFSLLGILRNLQLAEATAEIAAGLPQWQHPLLLAWGLRDPWLPAAEAETLATSLRADFVGLEQVGHYPQEDWPEKVTDALQKFLRQHA